MRAIVALLLVGNIFLWTGCAAAPKPPPAPELPPPLKAGDTNIVTIAPPAQPKHNLIEFTGIGTIFQSVLGVVDRMRSLLGSRFPFLESTPPVLPITDSGNADSPNPAVKAAAAAKADEDQAPQKIKALNYLASLGCGGCYPDVEQALLDALDDCTEKVRYAAVTGLREAAGNPCVACRSKSCCSPKVLKKLNEVANEQNNDSCFIEPSERVRRMARLAMRACGESPPESTTLPQEGPSEEVGGSKFSPIDQLVQQRDLARPTDKPMSWDQPGIPQESFVVARVNDEPIFQHEIEEATRRQAAKLKQQGHRVDMYFLSRQELENSIQRKLICQHARENLSSDMIMQVVYFDDKQPASVMGKSKNLVVSDDEEKLISYWLAHHLRVNDAISNVEMRRWYSTHPRQYYSGDTMVRWEQISAPFHNFPSRRKAIETLQNALAVAQGLPSNGPPESVVEIESNTHGWTSLKQNSNRELAKTLAVLPIGHVSEILEDPLGVQFVRVLQRRPAGQMPLEQVADLVRQEMVQERFENQKQKYIQHRLQSAKIERYWKKASRDKRSLPSVPE